MDASLAPTEEISRLRRCINDLVSVVALPAVWTGGDASRIVQGCFDALERMLQPDVLYAKLSAPSDGEPSEIIRIARPLAARPESERIGPQLSRAFRGSPHEWPGIARVSTERGLFHLATLPLGVHGDLGVIVAGSRRPEFPELEDRLVLSVAVNQVAIALQEARVLREQRRLARELDARVVERTMELQRSEAFLSQAQRLSSTGSFSWRVATGEMRCSEELRRIFALGAQEEEGLTLDAMVERVHPEDRGSLLDILARARREDIDFECEHRLLMPDHTVKHVHFVAEARADSLGQREYIGAVQDVTERRLSDEALGRVRSELAHVARVSSLGTLTASIAHEVNQPLAGIVTNAGTCLLMLAKDPPNVSGSVKVVRRILRDGNRAADVVTRLRALFTKKDGKTDGKADAVDLNDATREVIALTLTELRRSRAVLRLELTEPLPAVSGDRVQLQQVILNLLLNAAEAMGSVTDRPRELVVTTTCEEGHVRLSVQDVGVGIDADNADQLFQAFHTTKKTGMGIGLSVSRSIIASHHGTLWAKRNQGPGSTFSFALRASAPADVTTALKGR